MARCSSIARSFLLLLLGGSAVAAAQVGRLPANKFAGGGAYGVFPRLHYKDIYEIVLWNARRRLASVKIEMGYHKTGKHETASGRP